MLVDDKARTIGKVVSISTDRIGVEISRDLKNFTLSGYDDIHYIAQINSYVIIPYQNYYIVGEVASIREREYGAVASTLKDQELLKSQSTKLIEVLPFGTIRRDVNKRLEFSFGVSVYPSLYSDVLYIKDLELDSVYSNQEKNVVVHNESTRITHLPIGTSTIFKDYQIKIDIDSYFGSHSAVLGNTGSGKSCTISSIIQGVYKKTDYSAVGSTFIIFDVNGEYEQALGKFGNPDVQSKTVVVSSQNQGFKLPHWYFTLDEWELLLNTSEKTQRPILHTALGFSGLFEDQDNDEAVNHIVASCVTMLLASSDSPVSAGHRMDHIFRRYGRNDLSGQVLKNNGFNFQYGNFNGGNKAAFDSLVDGSLIDDFEIPKYSHKPFTLDKLIEYIELAILYEESHGNKQIRDYCSSLITRAKNVIEHPSFSFVKANIEEAVDERKYVFDILGINKVADGFKKVSQVYILDLNEADDDAVEIISTVLSRMIFDALKSLTPRNRFPVNLVMEEAHRYISIDKSRDFGRGNNIFERIAKEGRKYGLFLLVSSQRPSELSKTVLSQCSNFIVHRIQNPEDLAHIRQITPHISETLLKRLPSVPKQHALIFGSCVNIPSLIRINDANPRPKSDDNKISENWFVPDDALIKLEFD